MSEQLPARPRGRRPPSGASRRQFLGGAGAGVFALGLGTSAAQQLLATPQARAASFGYSSGGGYFTVTTGAGLSFKISQSNGDMTSLVYNGVELTAASRPSNVESGLGSGASVSAYQSGAYVVVSESVSNWYGSGTLHHYFVVRSGENNIYMATYVSSAGAGELRWIQSLNRSILTSFSTPADIRGGTAIESKDIYLVGGQTRSKYYGNRQAKDLTIRGASGSGVGVFMCFGNRESSSGGPFFRDIEQQGTSDSIQVYNYLWSGHNDTEPQRLGVLYGPYALMVTGGSTPAAPDLGFMEGFGFAGTVGASGRGHVTGVASGVSAGAAALVGWANSTAQYWAAPASDGGFTSPAMKAGTYTQTLYQGELAVATRSVTASAGATAAGQNIASTWYTPASPVFRIGTWDGTPSGFKNWANLTVMHPSDSRDAAWGPVTYTVGSSQAGDFPAYQWKGVNNPTTVVFNLASSQIAACTVRIGITAAFAGGRPQVTVNNWTSSAPPPSTQPSSRSLTIGTYRGNNALYTFDVPAAAFVAGTNRMTISVISGSSGTAYLSPGYSYDCVEMYGAQSSAGGTVTVANPGDQSASVGTAISAVQVHATDSLAGQSLTFTAGGLPAGLSISSSGLISGTPSAAGTFGVTVAAKDSTGASGSVSFHWIVSGGSGGSGGGSAVRVSYATASEWAGGFTANVTITNGGAEAISGWSVGWSFPGDQKVTSAWGAAVSQSGGAVTATNVSYDAVIAPGASVSFGFQGTWSASDAAPSAFTVNGTPAG
ncbi:cellulose binding domain-containing protein [Actinocrinis puniceicyclus]|uniref:1,4-alpha-D-glucan glucanohydrolase n=1 Tax=Actinocrinis puniceicyclus TaxID=977794 RepID=A0A8J8BGA5_9ACTN|nr:rhamnogalacturonan lyase B N-terminal domain-containing protein [Actinocrinis puniceicyclus]MBS2966936.1 cellulose binding domain-containing protein [Actinocrinis puniceicyclus]